MPPKESKTWDDFTPSYRSKLTRELSDSVLSRASTEQEAVKLMLSIIQRMEVTTKLPFRAAISQGLLQDMKSEEISSSQCSQLLQSLGSTRQTSISHQSQAHQPRMSVQDLDRAVVKSGILQPALVKHGYNISKKSFTAACAGTAAAATGSSRPGRKSKVDDKDIVAMVKAVLEKYTNESSKVVTVRVFGEKRLVTARLLSKRLWRIWREEVDLREQLGYSSFRKIVRKHFPSHRKPGRKTDVCGHCRALKRHILPRAEAEYCKRRRSLTELLPSYFDEFDNLPSVKSLVDADQKAEIIIRARKFMDVRNSRAESDPARDNLRRPQRFELFQREAEALHKLKGHTDLLEAYTWHKVSADRQREHADKLLADLGDDEAYFHFDFKENVRYPMAKEETGDEWHAQNKLSLTVFGVVVHTPGKTNVNFLLVSEVLDHDSQMARVLLSRVLDVVSSRAVYKWEQVKHLHMVCDCGPHFRSREGYAFFLHDIPNDKKIDAPELISWFHSAKASPNLHKPS